jgi:hypothetical protein
VLPALRQLAILCSVLLAAGAILWSRPALADDPTSSDSGIELMDIHAALGVVALGTFASSLVIGSASGNLGMLTDPDRCCPDGGDRKEPWRTADRALVTTGIVAYSGAAALAIYNLTLNDPAWDGRPRTRHQAHRWLALAHGAAFVTSAVSGIIMLRSQNSDPDRFARAARVHVASNVVLVPLLTMSFSNILFE